MPYPPPQAPTLGGSDVPCSGLAPEIGFWVGGACADCGRPVPEPEDPFYVFCGDCHLMRRPGGY